MNVLNLTVWWKWSWWSGRVLGSAALWFIDDIDQLLCDRSAVCVFVSGSLAADTMQSTTNYLWLISDLLGQGATANVYRGRHKVGTNRTDHWRVTERVTDGSLTGQSDADLWSCQVLWTIQAGWNQTRSHRTDRWSGLKQMNVKIQNFGSDVTK